jgi:hypothetical protein
MKKSFLFVAALALTFAACQPSYDVEDKTVATFEEAAISPAAVESVYHLAKTGTFTSGNFEFTQEVADYGEYGVYYFGNVVSNKTDNTYKDDYDGDKSVKGGAHQGKNFLVWTGSYTGADGIKLKQAAKVPGMYVCNSVYAYASMTKGDAIAGAPFGDDDWFLLTITGALEGKAVNTSVQFYLAKGKNIVTDWTYVDLSKLGKIDEMHFALTGSRTGDFGLNTPAYFCIDNLGASK